MTRPISRKLLEAATVPGEGPRIVDTEHFQAVCLQLVYTTKRLAVVVKGRMLGSPTSTIIAKLDSLTCKSGHVPIPVKDWCFEEVWAEVLTIDGGEVSLYFFGRD